MEMDQTKFHSNYSVQTEGDDLRPNFQEITALASDIAADLIGALRIAGRKFVLRTVDTVDRFADKKEAPHTVTGSIGQMAAQEARRAIELAKELKMIDKINITKLPRLLDDDEKDFQLKADTVDILDSRMGIISPFYDLIVFISNRGFDQRVDPARLTKFFESEKILRLLLNQVFSEENSRYRGPNVLAVAGSMIGAVSEKLRSIANKTNKIQIDDKTKEDLDRKLNKFKEKYKPESKYTVSAFVGKLKALYQDYDLVPWLEEQIPFFIEMLRGYKIETAEDGSELKKVTGIQHIKNMVHGAYEDKTKTQNLHEEFIRTHMGRFFITIRQAEIMRTRVNTKEIPCFLIDTQELTKFFRKLKKVKTREIGEGQMIDMIIRICLEETQKHGNTQNGITIMVHNDTTAETFTIKDTKDIQGQITGIIDEAINVSSPHINTQNLLVNPEGNPERIISEHERIFNQNGEINQRAYNAMLRSIFEHKEEDQEKPERMEVIRSRIGELFNEVNEILKDIFGETEITIPKEIEDILGVNDYSELINVSLKEKDKRKRYAARLKIELTWLTYRASHMPRFVFKDSDAQKIQLKMEATQEDIQIDDDCEVKIIKFVDCKDKDPQIIQDKVDVDELDYDDGAIRIGELKLIPAQFAGQDCYLLHNGNDKTPKGYINLKSLRSLVINRIRARSTTLEEISDMARMTFVVKGMEQLKDLKEAISTTHASLGRLIEVEDTYTETQENGVQFTGENESKSKAYRTLKYVSYVPIFNDEKLYIVQFEMRVILLEDAIKEKSEYHEIGHKAYESRRGLACIPIIAPKSIFPELYEEEKDPDDLSDEVNIRVKRALTSTAS